MQLKIDKSNGHSLLKIFHISKQRSEELLCIVEEVYNEIKGGVPGTVKPISLYYEKIANNCDTIEEYTFCLHNFIFNAAKIGTPVDSHEFTN